MVLAIACEELARSATDHLRYLGFLVGDTVRFHSRRIRKQSRALSLEFAHYTALVSLTEKLAGTRVHRGVAPVKPSKVARTKQAHHQNPQSQGRHVRGGA